MQKIFHEALDYQIYLQILKGMIIIDQEEIRLASQCISSYYFYWYRQISTVRDLAHSDF